MGCASRIGGKLSLRYLTAPAPQGLEMCLVCINRSKGYPYLVFLDGAETERSAYSILNL